MSMAKSELEHAFVEASDVQQAAVLGNMATVQVASRQLGEHAQAADRHTSDLVWRMFEVVPFLGPNLAAVRQLTQVVVGISEDVVMPVLSLAGSSELVGLSPLSGAVDLAPLVQAKPAMAGVDAAPARASVDVAAIDTANTLAQVSAATQQLSSVVNTTATSVGGINRAVQLLPAMLGADEKRSYPCVKSFSDGSKPRQLWLPTTRFMFWCRGLHPHHLAPSEANVHGGCDGGRTRPIV